MRNWILQWYFLYFPEDKSEYIPAALTASLFLIGAILLMWFFIRHSKKEAAKARILEKEIQDRNSRNE